MPRAKKADPLAELVSVQSNVPVQNVTPIIPTNTELAAQPVQGAVDEVHRIIPAVQNDTGLMLIDPGRPGQAMVQQPSAPLMQPREAPQAALPQQPAQAALPSHTNSMMPQPPAQGQQQQVAQQGQEHDDDHDGDDFFDPMDMDDVDPSEFDIPVPTARATNQQQMPVMQQARPATDPNAPPFDVTPQAPAPQQQATAPVPPPPPTAPPAQPVQQQQPPLPPVPQPAPTPVQMPATQGGNTTGFVPGATITTTVNTASAPQMASSTDPMLVGLMFDPFSPPPGPGMNAPASTNGETQISEALMSYIKQTVHQLYTQLGITLLRDPDARDPNNFVHAVIYDIRWSGQAIDSQPLTTLNQMERALAAHQVYVSGIENFWEARYQGLAKELEAQMFRNRENYPGTTKQEKENNCQSQDPNMRQLRHHFMLAQGMALATRNLGDRFKQLEDGLKRTIDTVQAELRKGMR